MPTKRSLSGNSGRVGPLWVFLLLCLAVFNIVVTHCWPWSFVYSKLTFNQETRQLLFVLCSVHHFLSSRLSADPHLIVMNIYTANIHLILSTLSTQTLTIRTNIYVTQFSYLSLFFLIMISYTVADIMRKSERAEHFFSCCSVFGAHVLIELDTVALQILSLRLKIILPFSPSHTLCSHIRSFIQTQS